MPDIISSIGVFFFPHCEVLYGHQGHHFHMLYFAADNESYNESKEIIYISRNNVNKMMRRMQNENLFFICFVFSLPSLGTARWQSSSSAVLFIHSSYLMGVLLPSFKEAMCLRNDTCDKRKLLFSKLTLGWGAWGQQRVCAFVCVHSCACACVCVCNSVCMVENKDCGNVYIVLT